MQRSNNTDLKNFHGQVVQRILNKRSTPNSEVNLSRFERVVDLIDLSDYHMMKEDDEPKPKAISRNPVGTQSSSNQPTTSMPARDTTLRNKNEFASLNSRDSTVEQHEFKRPESFGREPTNRESFNRQSFNQEQHEFARPESFAREPTNRESFNRQSFNQEQHEFARPESFAREPTNRESFNRQSFNQEQHEFARPESFAREPTNQESFNRQSFNQEPLYRESFDNTPRARSRNSLATSSRDGRQYEQSGFGRSVSRDSTNGFVPTNSSQQGPSNNPWNFRPRNSPSASNSGHRWNRNEDFNALSALPEADKIDRIRRVCMNGFGSDRREIDNNRNYGSRSNANKPRELTSQDKEYYNKNIRELRDTLENLHEDSYYMEKAAAKDPKLEECLRWSRENRGIEEGDDSERLLYDYAIEISNDRIIKYFVNSKGGFVRINEKRTREEEKDANVSKVEILHFVYCKTPDYAGRLNEWDKRKSAVDRTDLLIEKNGWQTIRPEDYSMITNFSEYSDSNCPPFVLGRTTKSGRLRMLRPVIIDGMAIQYLSSGKKFKPFYASKNSENVVYDPDLVINVRPIFEVVVELVLRGHKTTVCYPKYYEKYTTPSGLSKVDDIFAFKTMLDCGLIEFHEIERQHKYKWFNVVANIVDEKRAVFISSVDYDPRKIHSSSYKKESERILSPVFVMLKDVIMIFDASIRYRPSFNSTQFKTIGPDEILYFPDDTNEELVICEQLYLEEQVKQICYLAQLYRLKTLHQWSIKQILYIFVHANPDIKLPLMTEEIYHKLRGFGLGVG